MSDKAATISLGRHKANCSICAHKDLQEIERSFIAWKSPIAIAEDFGLSDRSSVYRHAHAFDLFSKRQRNVRAALEKLIERAGDVEVTAASVVSAIQTYSKLDSQGQWIDKIETVSLNDLFDRMSATELEQYAATGNLPNWFRVPIGATADND